MRLICPHCQQSVTFPDSAAGLPTPCPPCGQSITPPALTGAAIDAAPVPPLRGQRRSETGRVSVDPAVPSLTLRLGRPSPAPPWVHLTLRRDAAHWLAPVALMLAFVLTFFTWVAVAPNGTRIYTQNAWQAAGGGFTTDLARRAVMEAETDLNANSHGSAWLMFYLLLLIPTAVLAVADRVLARNPAMVPGLIRPSGRTGSRRRRAVCGAVDPAGRAADDGVRPGIGGDGGGRGGGAGSAASRRQAGPTTTEKAERDLRRDVTVARYGLRRTALAGPGSDGSDRSR